MKTYSIAELAAIQHDVMPLSHEFRNFLGQIPVSAKMLIWALPSQGKSVFALKFSDDIAKNGRNVLYVCAEENVQSGSMAQRARKLRISAQNLFFLSTSVVANIAGELATGKYHFCVIDSLNALDIPAPLAISVREHFPHIGFLFVNHSRKDGKGYIGGAALSHLLDVTIKVEDRQCKIVKNWYGALTEEGEEFNLKKYLE